MNEILTTMLAWIAVYGAGLVLYAVYKLIDHSVGGDA